MTAGRSRAGRTPSLLAGALRPMRVYERSEALVSLALATSTAPLHPHRIVRSAIEAWRWRSNPAGITVAAARRHPDRIAVVDDDGAVSFAELERRTNALARTWAEAGLGPRTTIGILCGNGSLFLEATVAANKLGASIVYLNTGFAGPQVAGVVERERIDALVHDDELAGAVADAEPTMSVSGTDARRAARAGDPAPVAPPSSAGRVVVLTSGTTGHPRGAARGPHAGDPLVPGAFLSCIPMMSGDTTVVPAPLFHGLGLFTSNLALALGSTVVLRRRFDPESTLGDIASHRARVLVAVPAMLQRILALPARRTDLHDVSSLRIVICGGAQLSGDLARRFMDRFGDVLYNVYGSTETALATVAGPRDLLQAPGTTGRPVPGVEVRVLDEDGAPAPPGVTGRVFVGSSLRFDGYTGGGYKEVLDGLVSTGDLGHTDRWGRLFIDGREDDMIVSGGENVFPAEVEEALDDHPEVAEAAVAGIPDAEFGERLRAYVVRRPGSSVTEEDLKAHVHDRLARFKTPREIVFLDALPRTATGKVIKRELGEAAAPAGEGRPPG